MKGFGWGTMKIRLATEYNAEENKIESSKYAIEYTTNFIKLIVKK